MAASEQHLLACNCERSACTSVGATYLQYRIDLLQTRVFQKTQSCDPEHCMENVDHIARSVRYASMLSVLRREISIALQGLRAHLPDSEG